MEVIKRKICIRDFQDRNNPYSNACLSGVTNGEFDNECVSITSGSTWYYGTLTGFTSGGTIEYYQVGMSTGVTLCSFPILITRTFDDLGVTTDSEEIFVENKTYYSGETVIFDDISYRCKTISCSTTNVNFLTSNYFEIRHGVLENYHKIIFSGESKIDEFRRYSKSDEDKDLFNPVWNTGYTFYTTNDNETRNRIISERPNKNGSKQNLCTYIIGYNEGATRSGIRYSDNETGKADISYFISGLTVENSILVPNIKEEYLIGVVEPVKVNVDVNIDRGTNSSFDKHMRLGEIRTLDDFAGYGNGYFKIKE